MQAELKKKEKSQCTYTAPWIHQYTLARSGQNGFLDMSLKVVVPSKSSQQNVLSALHRSKHRIRYFEVLMSIGRKTNHTLEIHWNDSRKGKTLPEIEEVQICSDEEKHASPKETKTTKNGEPDTVVAH